MLCSLILSVSSRTSFPIDSPLLWPAWLSSPSNYPSVYNLVKNQTPPACLKYACKTTAYFYSTISTHNSSEQGNGMVIQTILPTGSTAYSQGIYIQQSLLLLSALGHLFWKYSLSRPQIFRYPVTCCNHRSLKALATNHEKWNNKNKSLFPPKLNLRHPILYAAHAKENSYFLLACGKHNTYGKVKQDVLTINNVKPLMGPQNLTPKDMIALSWVCSNIFDMENWLPFGLPYIFLSCFATEAQEISINLLKQMVTKTVCWKKPCSLKTELHFETYWALLKNADSSVVPESRQARVHKAGSLS